MHKQCIRIHDDTLYLSIYVFYPSSLLASVSSLFTPSSGHSLPRTEVGPHFLPTGSFHWAWLIPATACPLPLCLVDQTLPACESVSGSPTGPKPAYSQPPLGMFPMLTLGLPVYTRHRCFYILWQPLRCAVSRTPCLLVSYNLLLCAGVSQEHLCIACVTSTGLQHLWTAEKVENRGWHRTWLTFTEFSSVVFSHMLVTVLLTRGGGLESHALTRVKIQSKLEDL